MENRTISIPFGMLIPMIFGKFYCHKCGTRLKWHAVKRTVKPGDPDYFEHNKIGRGKVMIGDVEVSEYDLQCPKCGHCVGYDAQRVISKIQKRYDKKILTDKEVQDHAKEAKAMLARETAIWSAVLAVVVLLAIFVLAYFGIGR